MPGQRTHKPVWCIFLRSLPVGGVERQFLTLVNLLSKRRRVLLVTIFQCHGTALELISENVENYALFDLEDPGKTPLRVLLGAPRRLHNLCSKENVDVLYSARDVANLTAALALRRTPDVRLLWGHRSSAHKFSPRIRALHPLCRLVQHRVHCQIANSSDGIDFYRSLGLCRGSSMVLPNFVDTGTFVPSPEIRERQRAVWELEDGEIAIGIVGRVAPMKNHEGFLKIASGIVNRLPKVRFLIIGPSNRESKNWLIRKTEHYNLSDQVMLLPAHPMNQMRQVYNALDILCSPSLYGEGFCNVIAEAMACGCPVVATDVGAARNMLSGLLPVVRPGDDTAFQEAVLKLINNPPANLASSLREKIVQLCDHKRITAQILKVGETDFNYPEHSAPVSLQQ